MRKRCVCMSGGRHRCTAALPVYGECLPTYLLCLIDDACTRSGLESVRMGRMAGWLDGWASRCSGIHVTASGKRFDRTPATRPWTSHTHHKSHITDHTDNAVHRSRRAPAAGSLRRRQDVKLYPSVTVAAMDDSSETAAHCDLHLPTRLPKALRQATPETDRRHHTPAPDAPEPEQNPCVAF